MADMHDYVTSISKIVSNEKEEEVVLRGHRLSELIQKASFAEAVFLMLTGQMPSKGQSLTLDALFTACVDHGITPAAMIGRASASYGTTVPQAISAGTLMFGETHGGAGDAIAHVMSEAIGAAVESNGVVDDVAIAKAAKNIVSDVLKTGGRLPGFGIPMHKADPRAPALLKVAQKTGSAGQYCRLLIAMERELQAAKGRPVPINLDGIVAALVLDLGFPVGCAAAFVMIPRSFSTLAHHLEEKSQNTRWRHVPNEHVTYTGPMPRDRPSIDE